MAYKNLDEFTLLFFNPLFFIPIFLSLQLPNPLYIFSLYFSVSLPLPPPLSPTPYYILLFFILSVFLTL